MEAVLPARVALKMIPLDAAPKVQIVVVPNPFVAPTRVWNASSIPIAR